MTEKLLLEESTKQLSVLLFEIGKHVGGSLWDFLKNKSKDADNYWYSISEKYLDRFYQRFGYIQVLGMHQPMSLSNVFVDISLLDSIETHKYLSIEALKKSFENSKSEIRSLQNKDVSKLDGIKLIETESRIMVVGAPGGGKSTYLKKIGIESFSTTNKKLNKYLPIFIELKNVDSDHTIYNLIQQELEIADFQIQKNF